MARKAAPDRVVTYWLSEIESSRKREKDFRETGQRVIDIYEGKKPDLTPFNILFSNTETLLPALYSALPRPVVERRFKDEDSIGKSAATAGARVLEFLLDTNVEGYETYDDGMRSAVLDALLPGRGVTCVKYDAEVGELPSKVEGEPPTPYKASELACLDTQSWNRVVYGYAKKWSRVPWIAYEKDIDKEEAKRLLGEEIANKLVYSDPERDEDEEKKHEEDKGERKTAKIYQIWDKEGGKKIRYVSEQYKEGFLKVEDDPLQLTGFFNQPRPLQFMEKSNDLLPVAMYVLYENQAKELNNLTQRINRIVHAIKAKAIYDGELGEDIKTLVDADDNQLVPADKNSSLAAERGLQNAIWFWPVEQLVNVLQQLYVARENCKQVIYEITGIADIMRGQTNASETLGAQQIKQSWGTLRLKRLQKEVQRYARDLLRMMLEVAATKFSEKTWAQMTGLPYLTQEQKMQLEQMVQVLQMQMSQTPPPQPGQPPQPNPLQQQLQQAQQQLQSPSWADVLGTLKDDTQRAYRIDIETNSTVEPEAVEDQKNITELMTAIGQFLNGVGPLVAQGVMPFQAAQSMLLAICRRYRFGSEIEDYIKAMQQPKPPDDGKAQAAQAKAQQDQEKHQAEMQQMQFDAQQKQQQAITDQGLAQQKADLEREKMRLEMESAREEHAFKMAELQAKTQMTQIVTASKIRVAQATAAAKEKQASQPAQ